MAGSASMLVAMTGVRFSTLGCLALLLPLTLGGCGDDGSGEGGSDGGSGGAGVDGSTGGSSGSGETGGASSTGGSSTGGSSTGGSGSDADRITELMADAEEECRLREMRVVVQFEEDTFAARLTGRVVDGSLTVSGSEELLEQEARLGHTVRLRWASGVADGDRVPVSGWVMQSRDPEENRYRCFDGEVQVRVDRSGDAFYLFGADVVYEGNPDGTCGARTSADEVALGCLPHDY